MAASSPLTVKLTRYMPADHRVYMSQENGPFRCDHCSHYGPAKRCSEPHIIEDARQGLYGLKLARDQAVVDPGGCSDYYDPWKAKEEPRAKVS